MVATIYQNDGPNKLVVANIAETRPSMTAKRKLVVAEILQGLGEELEWDSERGTDKQIAAVYAAAGELWRQAKGV